MLVAQISDDKLALGGLFDGLRVNVDSYKEIIDDFKNIESFDDFVNTDGKADWEGIAKAIGTTDARAIGYFQTLDNGKGTIDNTSASTEGMATYLKSTGQAFDFAALKAGLLNAALNAGIMLAVSVALKVVVSAIDNYVHASEKAIELTDELKSKYEDLNSEYESHKKTVDELASSYEKLSKGVDVATNKNISLSDEDYKEYLRITNELVDVFPSLYKTLDDNGNAILTLGQNGRTASEDLQELLKAEEDLNNFKISQDIDGLFGGVKVKIDEANKSMEEYTANSAELEKSFEAIKEISQNGIDLSSDGFTLSADLSNSGGIEYYNALIKALQNFNEELDATRRVELGGLLDPANVIQQAGDMTYDFNIVLAPLSDEEKERLQNEIKSETAEIIPLIQDEITSSFTEQSQKQQEADLAWQDFIPSLVATMKSQGSFKNLAESEFGKDIQNFAIDLVSNLDSSVASEMNDNPYPWVRNNIILPLTQLDESGKKEISEAYKNLLELNPDDLSEVNQTAIDKFIKQIADLLGLSPIDVRLNLGLEVDEDLKAKYDAAISKSVDKLGISKKETESIFTELGIDTTSEIDKWNNITDSINDATEAQKRYLEGEKSLDETVITSTITDSVQQIKDQLSSAFKELGDAYQNIFTENGFSIDNVDNDMLSGIKSAFEELEGFDTSNLDKFFDTLTNSASTADQVQQAFNDLATVYFYSTDTLNNLNDATAESIEQQLEEMGVVNAHEVVYGELAAKTEALALQKEFAAQAGYDLINATNDEVTGFLNHAGASEVARAYLFKLVAEEQVFNAQGLNTAEKIQKLKELATAYGQTAIAARIANMEKANQDGHIPINYEDELASLQNDINSAVNNIQIDFSGVGSKSAGSAGKEAADAYLEAFEKELKQLQDDKDNGIITEKQYLDALRRLYNKYFRDKKKYLNQYKKYEREYLEGLKSLYESAFSYLTSKIDKKIDAINDEKDATINALEAEKDAAIDALEAQKKAAEESYQSQIDLLEEKKKANQETIDGIQDEIDAIKDAADQRKRDLDLQKAQYELEKARNQRTILQYSEQKGMHYVKDDSAERDAKESVDDANREIQIADLEKQKKYYEDINDSIDEQISSLNDLIDKSNEYYDDLIEQTEKSYDAQIEAMEKYYDSLIDALEKQKEQFQSLTDLVEEAQMEALLKELGINEEALLNGSTEEFNKLRDAYLGIIKDMNAGNQGVLDSLTELSGVDMNNLTGYLDSTAESFDGLGSSMGNVTDKTGELDNVSNSLGSVSDNAENASTEMSNLKTASDGLNESLPNVSQQLSDISTIDSENINATTTAFNNLADAIGKVATALGIGAEDSVGGLLSTLQSLNEVNLGGEDGEGIISQFENLKNAIDAVSSAIGGGGGGESSGGNGDPLAGGGNGKKDKSGDGTGGDSSSVTGALDSLKAKADEVLGEGSEDNSEGSGVIGQFGQLKNAVDDVTTAIGISEEGSDGGSGQEGDESTLTGAIIGLGTTTEEVLGESGGEGVIGRFEQFKDVIGEANSHVTGISDGLDAIDGKEVECTITVNIKQNGSLPAGFGAWTGTAMNLESGSYNAKYGKGLVDGTAHVEGTTKVTGDWGVHQGGQALLGELGREIIVRQGKFFTVGENGAEMHNLQPGDIVFNHIQTEELLKNGHISSRGKAYANGTVNKPSVLDRLRAQGYEVQKYEWKDMYGNLISPQQMNEAAKAWVSGTYECLTPMNDFKEKIKETVKVIESANVVNNTMNQQQPINQTFNITMPNVTDSTSANVLMRDLQSISTKKLQYNWKK